MTQYSIEDFRKLIKEEYTSKGVIPPEPDSQEERELFLLWLKGKEHLSHDKP